MELVNRETNFNKVFTNAPSTNVGVMNPLAYNTKFVSLCLRRTVKTWILNSPLELWLETELWIISAFFCRTV
jgi:hypothetical protein